MRKITVLIAIICSLASPSIAEKVVSSQKKCPCPEAVEDYIIGPQDVIEIKVWDNPDLSGKVVVSLEGYINYYLIGKIRASGLTTAKLSLKITAFLARGYIVNPQVTAEVVRYRSQKIVITGEVARPGTYYLRKRTRLVEAISRAGGHTKDADLEILIVRRGLSEKKGNGNSGPLRIDLRGAMEGNLKENIYIRSGDYIFIPRSKTFFIMGEVKNPGKYSLEKGTTVLKGVSLAGGATDKAALKRTKIIRTVKKRKIEIEAKLNDIIKPDDIVIVPESYF